MSLLGKLLIECTLEKESEDSVWSYSLLRVLMGSGNPVVKLMFSYLTFLSEMNLL